MLAHRCSADSLASALLVANGVERHTTLAQLQHDQIHRHCVSASEPPGTYLEHATSKQIDGAQSCQDDHAHILELFGRDAQGEIIRHINEHRAVLRDHFGRNIRVGPHPERYFYQHPAIRPLLALCLTRGGTPQGPCGDYGAAPLPLDDRTLTRQPTSSHVPPALSNPHTHHIDSADALDGQTSAGRDCQDCCASSRGEYTMDGTYTSVMQALDEAQSSVADTFAASLCADGSDERNTVPKDPVPTGSSRVQEAGSRRCRQRSRTSVPALQPAATGIEASGSVSEMNCTRIDTGLNRQRSPSSADRLQALFRFVQTVAVSDLEQVSGARVQKKRARGRRARTRGGQGSESDLSKGDELDAAGSAGPRPRGNVEKSRCSSQQVSAASSSRRCTHGSCRKYASYGDPGRRVLLFCGRHKKAGNIDLKNRLCMFPEGCTARATYGTFLPRAADRAAGPELETSLPGVTGEGAGLDSTAGKGPDDYACAKEFDVKGGRSDGKFQGQAAAVAGVAEVGRGGGHVASDYSHQNVGQLARGVGISRMVEELGGPWGCGKGCQGLVGADEGTGRSQGTAAKLGLPPILQQSGRDEYEQAVGTLAAADASGGCRAQAASPEGLPVDSNLTCAEYLGVTGGDGEREVGTGDGARCDSRDTNERQGRRGVRARGRAPAIDAAYCAAHRRPCDVQLYRRFCEAEGCTKLPTFGSIREGRARRCAQHRLAVYSDVRNPRCIVELDNGLLCNGRAHWADVTDLRPVACTQHRRPHFVDVLHGGVKIKLASKARGTRGGDGLAE